MLPYRPWYDVIESVRGGEVKLLSVELIDVASHTMGSASQTRSLMLPYHEVELLPDGWIRWRAVKGPPGWRLTPPSMIRNVVPDESGPAEIIFPELVASGDDIVTPIRKRGRPVKSV
jgi:hypothetical protein